MHKVNKIVNSLYTNGLKGFHMTIYQKLLFIDFYTNYFKNYINHNFDQLVI